MALTLGPDERSEPLDVLETVYREHRRRFEADDWAVRHFEHGEDIREDTEPLDGAGCPGLESV